jgi:hypothetical protein
MKHTIKGWAFEPNEKELAKQNADRFSEISSRRPEVGERESRYGENRYHGKVPAGLSPKDIAILCDEGNVCYGAYVDITGDNFVCGIWND